MVLTLPSAAAKALPITLKEFSESLSSTWHHHAQRIPRPVTLGLAISGGVDSMALASLCARVQSSGSSDWKFRAFVVDHGARVGSSEEAQAVAELVNKKGIHTKVLRIEWPEGFTPAESSKFESLARGFRFRLLGEVCSDFNVQNLLLAHHEDDQYETILMRLSGGHRGPGLLGMRPNNQIPECYGIYGVYNSGVDYSGMIKEQKESISFEVPRRMLSFHGRNERRKDEFQVDSDFKTGTRAAKTQQWRARLSLGPMRIEDGGIRILRPLLQYSKERLIATCLQDDTTWFEDHTNADPTLTPRNAVRHIYNRHTLPTALQKDAIIALSTSLQDRKDSLEREALSLFDRCTTRAFEPRAGSLFIRFPKLIHTESSLATGKDKSADLQTLRETADRLLKYAIEAVTPYETRKYPLVSACNTVFPELASDKDQTEKYPVRFTVGGVLFQRNELKSSSTVEDAEAASEVKSSEVDSSRAESSEVESSKVGSNQNSHRQTDSIPMQEHEWFLSRQPHESARARNHVLEYPPRPPPLQDPKDGWRLYDGRFWIRITNRGSGTIRVRPLRRTDLQAFHALRSDAKHKLRSRLHNFAHGEIRFTLPLIVVVARRESPVGEEEETVLALPTLDIVVDGAAEFMDYDIRYKKVDWLCVPRDVA